MEYSYVQVGQENSFTWKNMAKGLELQIPLIPKLRDEKKIVVETLSESGKWFREHYKTTPATSVTANEDANSGRFKTVWFDSRFYRANLLWDDGTLRFRDIHLFDENLPCDYLTVKGTSTKCEFYTFPFVDGYKWSSSEKIAGLRFNAIIDGKETPLKGMDPVITDFVPVTCRYHGPYQRRRPGAVERRPGEAVRRRGLPGAASGQLAHHHHGRPDASGRRRSSSASPRRAGPHRRPRRLTMGRPFLLVDAPEPRTGPPWVAAVTPWRHGFVMSGPARLVPSSTAQRWCFRRMAP